MKIAVLNKSTLVSDSDVSLMAKACNKQVLNHLAPAWEIVAPSVTFYSAKNIVPSDAVQMVLFDNADTADALGYHDETPEGTSYGKVFIKPILDAGGKSLTGDYSVSATLSHEILELSVDPHVNLWADNTKDNRSYALETCDPVENDSYTINVRVLLKSTPVMVSNFVLPAYFDSQASKGSKFDYLNKLTAPFTMDAGGYLIVRTEGEEKQIFGEKYPEWKKAGKLHSASRTSKRIS